jgi:hypothetical protein
MTSNSKKYITTIYLETGHDYSGPDTDLKALIRDAQDVIDRPQYESPVTHVYISKFNPETSMPDSDRDPVWMWMRASND